MKKRLSAIVTLCLLLCAGRVAAQQPTQSVVPSAQGEQEDAVVSSRGMLQFDRQVMPPNHTGTQQHLDPNASEKSSYSGLVHNGRRIIGGNTSQFFLEYKSVLGFEVGKGVQAAYVPFRLGGYMGFVSTQYTEWVPTVMEHKWQYTDAYDGYSPITRYNSWFSVGGVCRLVKFPRRLDWQLYGGFLIGDGLGTEYGIRLAKATSSYFSWNSFSMGFMHTPQGTSLSTGLSCVVMGAVGLSVSLLLLPLSVSVVY